MIVMSTCIQYALNTIHVNSFYSEEVVVCPACEYEKAILRFDRNDDYFIIGITCPKCKLKEILREGKIGFNKKDKKTII
jgi:hypothetical protein